ncbi:DEAD/DEAH box helicase [Neogemmobacter tilapiae]|uniref:DEAD/DEAH box helicase n=1 Tax=Neogemmobacter tilapiae TaxID=875041 RepID=A0A918TN02_9RHOB|nr:DEAD/DEAH box helicase [Gemmobacter tilapiae]GHC53336.1 DEAD/DEAH box helicase [Gemmobacter tilapiae]
MSFDAIAAPLAAALAAKGYEKLTSVQTAVLEEGLVGRDLLVSAQTGSGKTVAFGLAIAPEILAGQDKLLFADVPLALIIAPTRELAQQVAAELSWLYGPAGAQIATCVGGMDYRTEKRALERGAHIVVGTPGRLRDHIERRSLDLSALRAVALDEADEMLDMGFQEDLEFILSQAPEERRTLMFSATVPKDIEALAKTYQRNAVRVQAQGEARQHGDIEYRGLSVAVRDKEHAIFNTLRYYEARTAIVFAKTRAAVNHLFARMTNRGFKVVALSGELTQGERMHALQALRDGRARVCIATDVAARGIDLPGLDLVIHADLPSNSETLLHRSGRTGRAGQKGVSALIVTPAEFRKAHRLLQGAKVVAEWGNPPNADDISALDDERLLADPSFAADVSEHLAMGARLIERFGAEQVAGALVKIWRDGRSAPEVIDEIAAPAAPSAPRERAAFGPSVWFRLSVGHTGRAEARWLLPKICDAGGITKNEIGAIRVQQDESFVQIAAAVADKIIDGTVLENGVTLSRMAGEPSLDRPERSPRAERPAPRAPRSTAPRAPRSEAPDHAPRGSEWADRAPRPDTRPERAERPKPAYQPKPSRYVEDDVAPAPRAERPSAPRGDKPAYAERAAKPYAERGERPAKPYTPRGDKPAYGDRAERPAKAPYKSTGFRSHGGPAGEGRATGFKSHKAEGGSAPRASFGGDRAERSERPAKPRTEGFKSHGAKADGAKPYAGKPRAGASTSEAKPFRAKSAGAAPGKPARAPRPAANASDTSRRFTPPKKPKG